MYRTVAGRADTVTHYRVVPFLELLDSFRIPARGLAITIRQLAHGAIRLHLEFDPAIGAFQVEARPCRTCRALRNRLIRGQRTPLALGARCLQWNGVLRIPPTGAPWQPFPDLTDHEREILGLIAQGYDNAELVRRLVLSPKTVRNHISNIFSKLQVADRAEAIARAHEAGLGWNSL